MDKRTKRRAPRDETPAAHEPEPVDIASESIAGEEDPGAWIEPPGGERSGGEQQPPAPDHKP
jgi:hypothetical protein